MNSGKYYSLTATFSGGDKCKNEEISHEELVQKIGALTALGWEFTNTRYLSGALHIHGTLGRHRITGRAIQQRKEVAA